MPGVYNIEFSDNIKDTPILDNIKFEFNLRNNKNDVNVLDNFNIKADKISETTY